MADNCTSGQMQVVEKRASRILVAGRKITVLHIMEPGSQGGSLRHYLRQGRDTQEKV
jgi:hypothetical protein